MQDSRRRASIFQRSCQFREVRNGAYREVLKGWFFVVAVIVLGAWMSTFWYNAGKALGEVTFEKRTNAALKFLGGMSRTAELPQFFTASMIGVGALALVPFFRAFRLRRAKWLVEPGARRKGALLEGLAGFLLMAGVFGLVGLVMVKSGWLAGRGPVVVMWRFVVMGGVLLVMEEWIFRWLMLGIFLRSTGWRLALGMASLLFAVMHFMKAPLGFNVPDPDASGVGLELLGLLLARLKNPAVWVGELLPLLAMGWLLAYARWRTGSLWLPLGLHAGWLLADRFLLAVYQPVGALRPLVGQSLERGLLPLGGFLLTGALVVILLRPRTEPSDG